MIDDATLAQWERLCANATEGPWEWTYDGSSDWRVFHGEDRDVVDTICGLYRYHAVDCPDAVFVAAAREAVPQLIQEVRRLQKRMDELDARDMARDSGVGL